MTRPDATKQQATLLTITASACGVGSAFMAKLAVWAGSVWDGWLIGASGALGIAALIGGVIAIVNWWDHIDSKRSN